jgi:hypothetical protein
MFLSRDGACFRLLPVGSTSVHYTSNGMLWASVVWIPKRKYFHVVKCSYVVPYAATRSVYDRSLRLVPQLAPRQLSWQRYVSHNRCQTICKTNTFLIYYWVVLWRVRLHGHTGARPMIPFHTDIDDDYRGVNEINASFSYCFRFLLSDGHPYCKGDWNKLNCTSWLRVN